MTQKCILSFQIFGDGPRLWGTKTRASVRWGDWQNFRRMGRGPDPSPPPWKKHCLNVQLRLRKVKQEVTIFLTKLIIIPLYCIVLHEDNLRTVDTAGSITCPQVRTTWGLEQWGLPVSTIDPLHCYQATWFKSLPCHSAYGCNQIRG